MLMRWTTFFYILLILKCSIGLDAVEWTEGTPWPESSPIVRTTAQIMEKAEKSPPMPKPTNIHLLSTPAALFPNFIAGRYEDSGVVPPDAMGVVGPSQFILAANGLIPQFR